MTPSAIKPVTFRFVAQHLNHCATTVPCCQAVQNFNENESTEETPAKANHCADTPPEAMSLVCVCVCMYHYT